MYRVRLAKQIVLHSDRLKALEQAMGVREAIDRAISRNNYVKRTAEKVEHFPSLEDYSSDGLRLIVWVEYRGKGVSKFLRLMRHRTLQAIVIE